MKNKYCYIQILQLYRILIDKKGMTTNIMKNHEENNKRIIKRMKQVRYMNNMAAFVFYQKQ